MPVIPTQEIMTNRDSHAATWNDIAEIMSNLYLQMVVLTAHAGALTDQLSMCMYVTAVSNIVYHLVLKLCIYY